MITKQVIQTWLNETQNLMIEKYDQLGFRASGEWPNSLSNTLEEKDGKYIAKIEGADYTYYMENGRRAGKFPPKSAILKWIDDKGIVSDINKNSLAFLIARKIAQQGTTIRPGLVSDVITDSWINELNNRIGAATVESVKSDIINTLKWQ